MTGDTYLFIDGEYLRQIHRDAMRSFFGVDGELDPSAIMQQARANRGYFYDAIDYARRPEEAEKAWETRVLSHEQFFAYVRSFSGFHVRPGSVRRGKRREQKEVDVQLAVDMLTHGFNKSMSNAVLIAGDIDFRPVVEELVRHGVFVEVWYHRNSFAQELPGAADFGREIGFHQLYSWNAQAFQGAHRIPRVLDHAGLPNGEYLKVGTLGGRHVELRKGQGSEGEIFLLWIERAPGDWTLVSDPDSDLIERYVAVQYAPIEWKSESQR